MSLANYEAGFRFAEWHAARAGFDALLRAIRLRWTLDVFDEATAFDAGVTDCALRLAQEGMGTNGKA